MLTTGHFLNALTEYKISGSEPEITSVEIDSRAVRDGSLFVAFEGERTDGHHYVATAFQRGATMALVEKQVDGYTLIDASQPLPDTLNYPFCLLVDNTETALQQVAKFWRSHFDAVETVGITGSIGKTSTKELTHAVLSQRFTTLKSEGNMNNEIGLPLTLLKLRGRHTHMVLEMGMYAIGEIKLLCDIARPRIGVVTNIAPVHMSRLGSIEAIIQAKRELVEAIPAGGIAILNKDDEAVMSMEAHAPEGVKIFTYGLDSTADVWASNIVSYGLDGIRFTLHHAGQALHIQVPLLGRHSVHTALRATAVGLVTGLSWEEIIRGLKGMNSQLRLVTAEGPHGSLILDDTYNASPDSVIAALNLLADLDGRRVAVLGDMLELGAAEEDAHKLVGRRAVAVANQLITVGQRGRLIGEEALAYGMSPNSVHIFESVPETAAYLKEMIQEGDVILVKGSLGMRMDRIVMEISEINGAD